MRVPPTTGRLSHSALLYRHPSGYQAAASRFVRAALASDQPVLVAVPAASWRLLAEELADDLGPEQQPITVIDLARAGRNPGRIIAGVLLDFAATHPGCRVAIVHEPVWPQRPAPEYAACMVHEALINEALAGHAMDILCPYDTAHLPADAVHDAHRTHPVLTDATGRRWDSRDYGDPVATACQFNGPLPRPDTGVATRTYRQPGELGDVRGFVAEQAEAVGLDHGRIGDLTVAVSELAANTVMHASGPGQVSVWQEPAALVCQVDDAGHIADPLVGRLPVPTGQLSGRGLLMVHQLSDLVRFHTGPDGTSTRIYYYLRPGEARASDANGSSATEWVSSAHAAGSGTAGVRGGDDP